MPSPPQPKDAPFDYNFGLPPEEVPHDWEFNEGTDAFTRVSKVGASNIQFLERIGAEDTGDDQKWKAVAKLGADHMKITKGTVVDDERKEIEREKKARLNNGGDPTSDEEKEANASDSDSDSDSSSSDEEDATLHPSDAPTETQEDENNMLDNDWDTSEWSMQEIESACGTLITECEKNSNIKRQELSIRMLLRLLDRHQEAVNYLTKVSESILNKAFPGILVDGIAQEALNLSHLLAAICPRFADTFSMLGPIKKVCKILTHEMALAASLLQWRHKVRRLRRELQAEKETLTSERFIRKKMALNMKTEDLNKKWRAMHDAANSSALPPEVQLSHLRFLLALCDPDNTRHATSNRREIVTHNGLLPISLCLKTCDENLGLDTASLSQPSVVSIGALALDQAGLVFAHQVAAALFLQISKERCLLFSILRSRSHEGLEKILAHSNQLPAEDICLALDCLDTLGANALKASDANMTEDDYAIYENNRQARLYHDEDASDDDASACPDELEDETEKTRYKKATRGAIVELLVQPLLLQHIIVCLESLNPNLFLGAVMVLHKFACTQGYNNVLIELIAYAGRALEKVVTALQHQDPNIQAACLALIKQLATKQNGRDGMILSKVVDMLLPLVCGSLATNSQIFVLALTAFVSLAQDSESDNIIIFAGPSHAPPPRHELYVDLMSLLTHPGRAPFKSVEHLMDMEVLQFVINFLCRPDNVNLFFDLSAKHKQMGGVVLHRISLHKEACQVLDQPAVLQYFAFIVQTNFTSFMDHHFGHTSAEKLLFFTSTQAACRGLAQIAEFAAGGDSRVLDVIANENIYKEVEELLSFSAVKLDDDWGSKLDCTDAAASLLASISRVPVAELHAESDEESVITLREDINCCLKVLKRLIEQMAKSLMAIVHSCPAKGAVNNAAIALAKLASTAETSSILLDMGAAKIVAHMFPEKPSILDAGPAREEGKGALDVEVKRKADREVDMLLGLDASCFQFVASLCRIPAGKLAIQSSGILKRCVERFHLSSGKKGMDLVVRGEIACVFGRLAGSQMVVSGSAGSANDYILAPNYNSIEMLVELVIEGGEFYRRARYWAAFALSELCKDTVRVVPMAVKKGCVAAFATVVKDFVRKTGKDPKGVPLPLLRPVLLGLKRIADYPLGTFTYSLIEEGLQRPLVALGSNVALQLKYVGVKDRETLGDVARDILVLLQDGQRYGGGGRGGVEVEAEVEGGGEEWVEEGEEEEEEGGGEEKKEKEFDGTYSSMGISTVGSLGDNLKSEEETHTTRLAHLDAEDPSFRNELRRRKEHYEMGSTYRRAREPMVGKEEKKSKSKVVEKIEVVKEMRESASTGRLGWEENDKVEGEEGIGGGNVGGLDVSTVPMLAMTRPKGFPSPKNKMGVGGKAEFVSPLLTPAVVEGGGKKVKKQLVTFKRPQKSAGLFVDPTFVDNQPTTEKDYDRLGNTVGKPRLLSASSLTKEHEITGDVETYSHEVEIMGSRVKVEGKRIAGPNPMLDDDGRPISAVTFENVHGSVVKRELAKLKLRQEAQNLM